MLVERKEYKEDNGEIGYIESIYKSDNILQTTYFPKMKRLYISFSRGQTYSYSNVDIEIYNQLESTPSQGKFFYKNINNKYEYRKEFTLFPTEIDGIKTIVENFINEQDLDDE